MATKPSKTDKMRDKARGLLEIDEMRLDHEFKNQPILYFDYAVRLSEAKSETDRLKAKLEVTSAELRRDILEDPAAFDLAKTTKDVMDACVVLQPEYKEALSAYQTALHKQGVLQAAVTALDHRKRSLEKLTDLFLANYFAAPQAGANAREALDEKRKRRIRRGEDDD